MNSIAECKSPKVLHLRLENGALKDSDIENLISILGVADAGRSKFVDLSMMEKFSSDRFQGESFFPALLNAIACTVSESAVTAVLEPYHVDSVYRDSYYSCYSKQHFDVGRFAIRMTLFEGEFELKDFLRTNGACLEKVLIGSCVINPIKGGIIGRTLIRPRYLLEGGDNDACMFSSARLRVSNFKINVFGKRLHIKCFPYRQQDALSYRCAEICLQALIEYYSNEYMDYGMKLGSDIRKFEQPHMPERELPSHGASYTALSKVLSGMGFYPCVHTDTPNRVEFRRALWYYAESGIPTLMTMFDSTSGPGHVIVCVGRGKINRGFMDNWGGPVVVASRRSNEELQSSEAPEQTLQGALERMGWLNSDASSGKKYGQKKTRELCNLYNMADYYEHVIVMDDNRKPYSIWSQADLSADRSIHQLIVPLHRSMILDAPSAERYMYGILAGERFGLIHCARDFLKRKGCLAEADDCDTPIPGGVCLRMFLASSRGFKGFRAARERIDARAMVYQVTPLPHFVWVGELYLMKELFPDGNTVSDSAEAFGEVVIDATMST